MNPQTTHDLYRKSIRLNTVTAKLRMVVHQAMDGWARIVEVEAFDSSQGQTETFAYDQVGNRVSHTQSGATHAYAAGSNRLQAIHAGTLTGAVESAFSHDLEGRLTGQTGLGAKTLAWDAKGRVKTVNGETYSYDPLDYRIGRSGGSLGSLDYFLEGEHLESVYSGTNLYAKYFRGSSTDELVAGYLYDTDSKLKPFLFHHDNVTSTTAVSGHNGGTIQSTSYGAFGNILNTIGTSSNRLKYTGREDDGTGLYYYRARYYDPAIGRFISEDPLGFEAGINFYAYVHNNPVNGNDPSGLIDYIYKPGSPTAIIENQLRPGVNYFVDNGAGTRYPAGVNAAKNLLSKGKGFDQLWGPQQTRFTINQGIRDIVGSGGPVPYGSNTFNSGVRRDVIANSGPGRPYDLKQWLPKTDLYVVNGVAQMNDYVGNVIWGGGVKGKGLPEWTAKTGGQYQALRDTGRFDDAQDQAAISAGFSWYVSSGASGSWAGASPAGGGFLLYPNKANTNMMQSVYSK